MKVRKAIIPAAGLGTRVLPASKAIPKEMLNIVDKPAIQYIVEEAFDSGIEEILIITNRNKGAIEDHLIIIMSLSQSLQAMKAKKIFMKMCLRAPISAIFIFCAKRKQRALAMQCFAPKILLAMSLLRFFTGMMLFFQKQSHAQSSFVMLMKNTARA